MAGYKILIVEDEPIHLNVMKAKLEYEGYEISVATDGEMGLNMIKSQKPDLVLLDIILPKMNGFEILENLKKEGFKPPIIVVSNSGQPVEVDRALKLGAVDYLVKAEFNPIDVLEKAEKVLGRPPKVPEVQPAKLNTPTDTNTEYSNNKNSPVSGKAKILIIEDDKNTSPIPVIVLSNLGQKEDMDKALAGGAEDFMVKAHFTPSEIVAKIKFVLKKKYF